MSLILGMNMGHDGSVALVDRGRLVAAVSRERLTRKKKAIGVTWPMVEYVLASAGASLGDVTHVALTSFYYDPANDVKIFTSDGSREIAEHIFDVPFQSMHLPCQVRVGNAAKPAVFVHHHLSHCASAYYTSPFEQAACFSLDASTIRPEACSLFAYGENSKLYPFYCPGLMIGNAYSAFTAKLGLGPGLFKAGTTMGLAPYGTVSDLAKARWQFYAESFYARKWMADDPTFINFMWSELSGLPPHQSLPPEKKDSQEAMDIAASLQYVFEETIVSYANHLFDETQKFNGGNICLSGGSFLNCNVNTAIKARTPFRNVHLFPACGDDGTAVGAALWLAHNQLNERRASYAARDIAYLGRDYSASPLPGSVPVDLEAVARSISQGGIVAWFQGRSEFGPRALGNRSILADPRNAEMRDIINSRVKHREWFRPFAPSVLAEHSNDWFEFPGESPFMLHTSRVRRPTDVPAITHVDGTARHQTVRQEDNPRYYGLIEAFFRITGVPMLLNTSLNGHDEPLVETPEDAKRFFDRGEIDLLVVNDRMISKNN
ncbi:MAG: hypothetical protein JO256_12725 [Alphaproteobacteria bacterium]|nr:hypothetical protein [Alphaproteobacteria bacterium]